MVPWEDPEKRGGLPRLVSVRKADGVGEQGAVYRSVLASHHHKLLRIPEDILEARHEGGQYHIRINLYLAVILPPLHVLKAALASCSAHDEPFLRDEIALVRLAMKRMGEACEE